MSSENPMTAEEVHQCAKCGACLTACPVYSELRNETASPRAKVQLIGHYAEKGLPASEHLGDLVNRCLMCGSCAANCPSGVKHDRLFMRMRSHLAEKRGLDWKLRALWFLLTDQLRQRLAARFARLGNAVLEHLAWEVNIANIPAKRFPRVNAVPFREEKPEVNEPDKRALGTLLYFAGCSTNHLYGEVGHAVVRVLTAMGFRVEVPRGQVCCGLPVFAHGGLEGARSSIETNVALFDRPDIVAVVTDCATCGSALRKGYPEVLRELGQDPAGAESLGHKVRDVAEFIAQHHDLVAPLLHQTLAEEQVTTYHAPCHLRNVQGIKTEVEELLCRLPHVEYRRAADFDSCCGGGGTFFYEYPDISRQMVTRKIANARATGATVWVTGCPGCRLNLAGNLSDSDPIAVLHPVQLVEQALT